MGLAQRDATQSVWRPQRSSSLPNRPQERWLTLYFLSKQTPPHLRCGPAWRIWKNIKSEISRLILHLFFWPGSFSGRLKVKEHSVGITIISLCSFQLLSAFPPYFLSYHRCRKRNTSIRDLKMRIKSYLTLRASAFLPAGCSFRQTVENLTGALSLWLVDKESAMGYGCWLPRKLYQLPCCSSGCRRL